MTLAASTFLGRSNSKLACEIDGEIVLIGIADGRYYGLDDIGTLIWKHLDVPARVDTLCQIMCQSFAGDRGTITQDLTDFLEVLVQRDVLTVS